MHYRPLWLGGVIFVALHGLASPACAEIAGQRDQAMRFLLAGTGEEGGQVRRTFRVEVGGAVLGNLTIACAQGEMVSAAYEPSGGRGDGGMVARRADRRLCLLDDLNL